MQVGSAYRTVSDEGVCVSAKMILLIHLENPSDVTADFGEDIMNSNNGGINPENTLIPCIEGLVERKYRVVNNHLI